MKRSLCLTTLLFLFSTVLMAQISSPNANGNDVTQYPVFPDQDDIFIFCTNDSLTQTASLMVSTLLSGTKTFTWEKYNELNASFEPFSQESSSANTSQINALENGCYRATVSLGSVSEIHRAWVFNNWTYADAYILDSNCESFRLDGEFSTAILSYYDLSNNTELTVYKEVQAEWYHNNNTISSQLSFTFYDPPTTNEQYTLRIFDKFDCDAQQTVNYESIVTKANFTASPMSGEGPLEVTFTNSSENGSPEYYEWFFYRDIDEIKKEAEETGGPVDSIEFVAYDEAPIYTYENSGHYLVKLVSKHISDEHTCVDTFILEDYIVVDTSFVSAPNVFTPNGDGVNDEFIIKFWSMKNLEIHIFNRWGKRVHYWKSGDVQGFEGTWTESVWDGRIGNRYASPGVYYYDVLGLGRDGRQQKDHGFFHLFREK